MPMAGATGAPAQPQRQQKPPQRQPDPHADSGGGSAAQLHALQQQLQRLHDSSSSSGSATGLNATADELAGLHQAAAALRRQQEGWAAGGGHDSPHAAVAAAGCAELLVQMLLQPPEQLFAGLSGAPSDPAAGLELAGESFHATAAAQLQLLALLLRALGPFELPFAAGEEQEQQRRPHESASRGGAPRNRPQHFVGIVEIEEVCDVGSGAAQGLSPGQQLRKRLQQLLPQAVRCAALYAADGSRSAPAAAAALGRQAPAGAPSSGSSGAASTDELMGSFAAAVVQQGLALRSPWTNAACQQHAQELLRGLVRCAPGAPSAAPSSPSDGSTGRAGSREARHGQQQRAAAAASAGVNSEPHAQAGGAQEGVSAADLHQQQQQQQQQQEQAFWRAAMPGLLDQLRDSLLAQHRHRQAQERGDMEPYSGPSTFQRCLAARQLAWALQQQQQASLDEELLGLMLPLLLAAADDPTPAVQQYGHAGLGWLGLCCKGSVLGWQGPLLRSELQRLVVGCEEGCWATAMPAATSLALALEGSNPRSATHHALLAELLAGAERGAQKPEQRCVFMACAARLAPALGLHCLRHFAALLPLLLEWAHAYDAASSAAALGLLALLAERCWPRMGAHAAVLRRHAEQVLLQAAVEAGGAGSGGARSSGGQGSGGARAEAARRLLGVLEGIGSRLSELHPE